MATDKETIKAGIQVEGVKETLRAIGKLDKETKKEAKAVTKTISERLAGYVRAALSSSRDARYQNLAASVKVISGRTPTIQVGQRVTPRVSGGAGPAQLLVGMEFGADQAGPNAWRFPPRTPKLGRGNEGYFIYPTVRSRQSEIVSLWFDAMTPIIRRWSS